MRNKTAKQLRKATRLMAGFAKTPVPSKGYQVVPHTVREKEFRHPWTMKDEPADFAYATATLRLVPGCLRSRYQHAKSALRCWTTAPS